jgi:hypothetical protein
MMGGVRRRRQVKTILTMRLAPPLHLPRPEILSSQPPSRKEQMQKSKRIEMTERKPVTYMFMKLILLTPRVLRS